MGSPSRSEPRSVVSNIQIIHCLFKIALTGQLLTHVRHDHEVGVLQPDFLVRLGGTRHFGSIFKNGVSNESELGDN